MSNPFSIRLDDKLKARLEDAAKTDDRSLSYIAHQAIAAYLDDRDYRHEQIMRAYQDVSPDDFISDQAVTRWVESWGEDEEQPVPTVGSRRNLAG